MKKIALVVVSLCCASFAFAGEKPMDKGAAPAGDAKGHGHDSHSMMDMKPAAEIEQMAKGMVGTWSCDGKSADMGKPTMHPIQSTMKMTRELDGHWIMVDYSEKKTKENPMPFAFKEAIGFNKAEGKFHRMFIDNMGGTALMKALPAAQDGKMEWTGDAMMGNQKMPMKDVITMKGEKEAMIDVSMQAPDGKWMNVAQMSCKKK